MKRIKNIFIISLVVFAAAALLVSARNSQASTETTNKSATPAKKGLKKKPVKKKTGASARKPASEYKFDKVDSVPTYKFDKNANPIIKKSKPNQKSAGKAAASKAEAAPQTQQKLKLQLPPDDGGRQQGEQQQNPE